MAEGQPQQISKDWWMAMAPPPIGQPYFHNTVTGETTWIAPMLSAEAAVASTSNNLDEAQKQADTFTPETIAAQNQGMAAGIGGASAQMAMQQMLSAAPPSTKSEITATGSGYIPSPWYTFDMVSKSGKVQQSLLDPMIRAGFATPTSIQSYTWSIGCEGRDMVGVAKTGSGKTLGFLVPAFARIIGERMSGGPLMLVMAPTRELAVQIDQDARKFLGPCGATTALAYGGAPKNNQLADLRNRPHLLTATPGRLNDFLESRAVSLDNIGWVCLDEADRMLDMGFEPQIRKILSCCPIRRQTYMFTATWPKEVRHLANDFMWDPVEIRVGDADELQANQDIDQQVQICRDMREKDDALLRLVRGCNDQVLVFTATKRTCEDIARTIQRAGYRVESIHGDRGQGERDRALSNFKSGQCKCLVATDVAARGLDVKTIRLVINYDPANNAEDYVHRIGRTARAGMTGTAVSLLMASDGKKAKDIADVMRKSGKQVPPEIDRMAQDAARFAEMKKSRYNRGNGGKVGGGKGGGNGAHFSGFGGGGGFGGGRSRSRSPRRW